MRMPACCPTAYKGFNRQNHFTIFSESVFTSLERMENGMFSLGTREGRSGKGSADVDFAEI